MLNDDPLAWKYLFIKNQASRQHSWPMSTITLKTTSYLMYGEVKLLVFLSLSLGRSLDDRLLAVDPVLFQLMRQHSFHWLNILKEFSYTRQNIQISFLSHIKHNLYNHCNKFKPIGIGIKYFRFWGIRHAVKARKYKIFWLSMDPSLPKVCRQSFLLLTLTNK